VENGIEIDAPDVAGGRDASVIEFHVITKFYSAEDDPLSV